MTAKFDNSYNHYQKINNVNELVIGYEYLITSNVEYGIEYLVTYTKKNLNDIYYFDIMYARYRERSNPLALWKESKLKAPLMMTNKEFNLKYPIYSSTIII